MKTATKPKRVPRQVRKALEKSLKKAERDLLKNAFVMIDNGTKMVSYPENEIGNIKLTLMDKSWLKESGGDFTDPNDRDKQGNPKVKKIRLEEFITYERGKVKVDGQVKECVRPVSIDTKKVVKFFEKAYSEKNLKECFNQDVVNEFLENLSQDEITPTPSVFDANLGSINNGKLLPYPPGPFTRQIYLYDQWKMLSRCASYVDYNALAKSGVYLKTAFVIGTGPKLTSTNVKLQELWDQFVEKNDFINRLKNYDRMLTTNGEFFGEIIEERGEDVCKIRSIDPGTIYDIITEPRDIEKVYGYQLTYPTQYQMYGRGAKGENIPLSAFVYETLAPENICHLKINVQENEKRGRSDLLPVLNICQFFADYLRYRILRSIIQAAFTWDIKLTNADQTDIDAVQQNEQIMFPPPMSTFVHNENVERTPVQSQGTEGAGRSTTFQEIITAFCIGFLMNKEYMNAGDSTTRASAISNTEPTVKIFQDRRGLWESYIRKIVFYLAEMKDLKIQSSDFEIIWPEIAPENVSEKITNLLIGVDRGVITMERFANMYAKEMDIRAYNFEDEMKDKMKELNDALMQELFPVGLKPQGQPTKPETTEDPFGPKEQASNANPGASSGPSPLDGLIKKTVSSYAKPSDAPKANSTIKAVKAAGKP